MKKNGKHYKKVWKYFSKHKFLLFIYFIISMLIVFLGTIIPIYSSKVIEAITKVDLKSIIMFGLLLGGLDIAETIINLIISLIGNRVSDNVVLEIKKDASSELLKLNTKNFDKEGTSFFVSRINNDPEDITYIFTTIKYDLINVLTSVGTLFFVFYISWKMAILYIIVVIILVFISKKQTDLNKQKEEKIRAFSDEYTSNFGEVIRGEKDIKTLNMKNSVLSKMKNEQEQLYKLIFGYKKTGSIYRSIYNNTRAILEFVVLLFGVYLIHKGELSGANLLIIYMYRHKIFIFGAIVGYLYEGLKTFNAAIERLYGVLDNEKYAKEKFGLKHLDKLTGEIEFKNLSFGYDKNNVLNGINLKINANETVGFVGKSGGGKTTIFNVLTKLYEVNDNQIFFDGYDINSLTEDTLRNNISAIIQNPYIFNMTIKENIKLANSNMSDEEVIEKSKLAQLHDFVISLEKGYDTKVGENGVTLSGGQKQRLAIARALSKESKIILLDEATSALDNKTQNYVHEAIKKFGNDYTVLIIAHRLSTVKECDKIVLIDEGKIKVVGKHEELLKSSELYKSLYNFEEQN